MAGTPKKRLMLKELERRAHIASEDQGETITPLQYVCEWVAAGQPMADLIRDMNVTEPNLKLDSAGILSSWVNSTKEGKVMISEARAVAAHALAEQGMDILDDSDEDRDAIAKNKARSDYRKWLASVWNRPQYGQEAQQVQVNVNLPMLHIEAMRKREMPVIKAQPILPPSEPDYQLEAGAFEYHEPGDSKRFEDQGL